jgi:hypothetical protein
MSVRSVLLALAITTLAVIVALVVYHRPYWRAPTVRPANESAEAMKYAQEFADALTITDPTDAYLRGGGSTSPDGRFKLHQRPLRNHHHEITISSASGSPETVLILQEGDPGSGPAHDYQWSRDSKAVFIYGWGDPAGHVRSHEMAIIYLVEQRSLFALDLKPFVANRRSSVDARVRQDPASPR